MSRKSWFQQILNSMGSCLKSCHAGEVSESAHYHPLQDHGSGDDLRGSSGIGHDSLESPEHGLRELTAV
ncbi:hypothetical protein BDV39DRAFT_176332, partial [Aspergillus sergii]